MTCQQCPRRCSNSSAAAWCRAGPYTGCRAGCSWQDQIGKPAGYPPPNGWPTADSRGQPHPDEFGCWWCRSHLGTAAVAASCQRFPPHHIEKTTAVHVSEGSAALAMVKRRRWCKATECWLRSLHPWCGLHRQSTAVPPNTMLELWPRSLVPLTNTELPESQIAVAQR